MTESTGSDQHTALLNPDDEKTLELFADYLLQPGIQAYLIDHLSRDIPSHNDGAPTKILNLVLSNLFSTDPEGYYVGFDPEQFVDGAPSLHYIVGKARMIDRTVLPASVIPDNELVQRVLTLCHKRMNDLANS